MADKRQVYAEFHASVEGMLQAALRKANNTDPETEKETGAQYDRALAKMNLKFVELMLVAPEALRDSAYDVVTIFSDEERNRETWMVEFSRLQQRSINSMRADLGEPV